MNKIKKRANFWNSEKGKNVYRNIFYNWYYKENKETKDLIKELNSYEKKHPKNYYGGDDGE
jgi:hypothetical protein